MTRIIFISNLILLLSCHKDLTIQNKEYSYFNNSVKNKLTDSSLTILTYNIQLGFTSNQDPWDKNQIGGTAKQIHDISEIIRKVNPNIVILQEIPKNRSNIEIKNFLETLADTLNMNYAFGGHGKNDPTDVLPVHGIWGNAILSKFPINNIENIKVYYEDQWKTRSVLKAEVKLNDNLTINVYNLHHNGKDTNEVKNTSKFVARSKFPVIVGGDFNRRYGNPELNLLGLQDIFKNDINGIDRIYCNINNHIINTGTIYGSNIVSDHVACYARLKIN